MKPKDENVRYEFDSYCKKVLKGAARNYFAKQKRQAERETPFSELSASELSALTVLDSYSVEQAVFNVQGEQISITDADLAVALAKLTDEKRDIVLLSYFVGLTDKQIASRLDMVRRTVAYRKASTLKELKKIMEDTKDE